MARDYEKEYKEYHGTPEQRERRSQRNKARRKLGLKKGDPKVAGHVGKNRKGKLGDKVRAISVSENQKDKPKRDGSDD